MKGSDLHKMLVGVTRSVPCAYCGAHRFPHHYHHLEPERKLFRISNPPPRITTENLVYEMEKCCILCATCHILLKQLVTKDLKPLVVDRAWLVEFGLATGDEPWAVVPDLAPASDNSD